MTNDPNAKNANKSERFASGLKKFKSWISAVAIAPMLACIALLVWLGGGGGGPKALWSFALGWVALIFIGIPIFAMCLAFYVCCIPLLITVSMIQKQLQKREAQRMRR